MRLVCIESPFAGATPSAHAQNILYLRACLRDSLKRGESPYASHRMLTDALDDTDPVERDLGIRAGFAWAERAGVRVFYLDRGFSSGMVWGLKHAIKLRQPIEIRGIGEWRGPLRLEALRRLNGKLPADYSRVDWGGFA